MAREFSDAFYHSKVWKQCRTGFFKYKHGLCERCDKPGDIVHHKELLTPGNINDPNVTLNWNNLELLCQECHNNEHFEKYSPLRHDVMFNDEGQLVKREGIRV